MITYGTYEKYNDQDWLLGNTINVDTIVLPALEYPIEYNQNEFKQGSYYCTLYMCFGAYSMLTGKEINEQLRKEMIEECLASGIIVDGVGGYLHQVIDYFRNKMREIDGVNYMTYRVLIGGSEYHELRNIGYPIMTGFRSDLHFNRDVQDNCVVDDIISVEGSGGGGHAVNCIVLDNEDKRLDNYKGRRCNIYGFASDEIFNSFIWNRNRHFTRGYIFTMPRDTQQEQQELQDRQDIQRAIDTGITNGKELDQPATRQQVVLMIMRAIKFIKKTLLKG